MVQKNPLFGIAVGVGVELQADVESHVPASANPERETEDNPPAEPPAHWCVTAYWAVMETASTADLRITEAERGLLDDKLGLLNEAIRSYQNSVPFQNLTLFSTETKYRAAPTQDQVKQDVLSGKGGLCMTQNVFFFYLLQTLDYDVFLISSSVSYPISHVIVGVRNVAERDDVYLAEVGCGHPTFQAIPLNFQEESPIYQHSFLEYRFVKKGELIERQHRRGDTRPVGPGQQPGTWRRFYDFTLEPRDVEFFREPMNTVYTVPARFLQSLRVITFQKGRLRAIKDWSLLEEQDDHTLRETQIHSMSEMMAIIKEIAPKIDQDTVTKALSHWQEGIANAECLKT
ncbi:hypothetical protein Bbelb_115950 [Branchiostoma belcheri]|nr:hypothetical protein Bbelb_115950 [Branchiostoma belcheri]